MFLLRRLIWLTQNLSQKSKSLITCNAYFQGLSWSFSNFNNWKIIDEIYFNFFPNVQKKELGNDGTTTTIQYGAKNNGLNIFWEKLFHSADIEILNYFIIFKLCLKIYAKILILNSSPLWLFLILKF